MAEPTPPSVFTETESPARPTARRKPHAEFHPEGQVRRVKTYPFTTVEIAALSILNPTCAGLVGMAVNMMTTEIPLADTSPGKAAMRVGWIAMFAFAALIQAFCWAFVLWVRRESKPKQI